MEGDKIEICFEWKRPLKGYSCGKGENKGVVLIPTDEDEIGEND